MKTLYQKTQATEVLAWLRVGKTLTRYEGFMNLRIADLPKVIAKIRKSGAIIETEMITNNGKYGPTKYAKYHLIKDSPQIDLLEALLERVELQLDQAYSIKDVSEIEAMGALIKAIEPQLDAAYRSIKDTSKVDLRGIYDATD